VCQLFSAPASDAVGQWGYNLILDDFQTLSKVVFCRSEGIDEGVLKAIHCGRDFFYLHQGFDLDVLPPLVTVLSAMAQGNVFQKFGG
jgi:hypothetical protein